MTLSNRYMQFFKEDGNEGGASPSNSGAGEPKEPSVDELKNSLHASRRREKELSENYSALDAEYKEVKNRLTALEAKEKELSEKEMTELDKARKEKADLEEKMNTLNTDYESLKQFKLDMEEKEQAKVAKAMEELTDEEKEAVEKLSLFDRMGLIQILQKNKKLDPGGNGKGARTSEEEQRDAFRKMTPTQRDRYVEKKYGS